MRTEQIEVSAVIDASAEAIFDAWIDGEAHGAMTGAEASSEPRVGGRFTAWDGYIEGTHEALERPRRLVQRWRTSEFPEDAPDSILELALAQEGKGTRLTLTHREIPEGQGAAYAAGWEEHYFSPMRAHFAR